MNRLKTIGALTAVISFAFTCLAAEQQTTDAVMRPAKSYITGLLESFPVSLALPANFIVMPLDDDAPDIDGGLLWGDGKVLKKFKKAPSLNASKLAGPMFLVTISNGVMQIGREKFNIEGVLADQFKTAGMKDVVVTKAKWGEFPVLHFRAVRPDGRVALGAWVGLNTPDGVTMFFDFRTRSVDRKTSSADERIWEAFLNKTK